MISNRQLEVEYDEKFARFQKEQEAKVLRPGPSLKAAIVTAEDLAGLKSVAKA